MVVDVWLINDYIGHVTCISISWPIKIPFPSYPYRSTGGVFFGGGGFGQPPGIGVWMPRGRGASTQASGSWRNWQERGWFCFGLCSKLNQKSLFIDKPSKIHMYLFNNQDSNIFSFTCISNLYTLNALKKLTCTQWRYFSEHITLHNFLASNTIIDLKFWQTWRQQSPSSGQRLSR